jgi:hypothetical protein
LIEEKVMNDYDLFEAELQDAGWSPDEIEALWQKHQVSSDEDTSKG